MQVVEARDRVGGRIHSMRGPGHRQEAGGAYIGAGYRRVIAAARRFDAELVDVSAMLAFFREQELVLDGELIRQSEWPDHPRNPFPGEDRALMPWTFHRVLAVRENPLDSPGEWLDPRFAAHDVPVHEWLSSLGYGERAIRLGYGLNPSFGDDALGASALLTFFRAAFSVAQRRLAPEGVLGYTVRDGVQRIPEAMTGSLRREVHFGRAVTAIGWGRRGEPRSAARAGRSITRRTSFAPCRSACCEASRSILRSRTAGGGHPNPRKSTGNAGLLRAPLALLGRGRLSAEHVHGRPRGDGRRVTQW